MLNCFNRAKLYYFRLRDVERFGGCVPAILKALLPLRYPSRFWGSVKCKKSR
jgi:hypothetical protein